ncbi:disulfide bond formation protein B [Candidatus Albibeggiatoa sp. nov. NOAA]|uniref:disulfide bond formation protein B n=1 Tax=Candidatus Albibeggiatoa sp. nov. NOAA TaxID=3162724 RepID=UPI0032FCB964|nr:disulfide bond formation protein B [Thiotrichaceae bacterium]
MKNWLACTSRSVWYWLIILVLGAAMEATALYYQHQLYYGPCALCIHVRIYIMFFMLIALAALFIRHYKILNTLAHLTTLLLSIGLLERSWKLLGTERGFIEGACSMKAGLPAWFALDKWFPNIFEPWESCGYTPPLLLGITMAEALVALGVTAIIVTAVMSLSSFKKCD